ncbi:hypothetical protein NL676_017706 [Syzygium grande]|nr:hypothetical protein NL676_017706 [Syzygium grande]
MEDMGDTQAAGPEDTRVKVAMVVAMVVTDNAGPTISVAADEDTTVVEVAGATLMLGGSETELEEKSQN